MASNERGKKRGRGLYSKRDQIIEAVFGQIKETCPDDSSGSVLGLKRTSAMSA